MHWTGVSLLGVILTLLVKGREIYHILLKQSTGLRLATAQYLLALTSTIRLLTVVFETEGLLFWGQYLLDTLANIVIFALFLGYQENTRKEQLLW